MLTLSNFLEPLLAVPTRHGNPDIATPAMDARPRPVEFASSFDFS